MDTATPATFEEVQEAAKKAFWTATPVEGFKHDSVRKYRHEAKALLAGKVGLTVEEQNEVLAAVIETLNEAIAYSSGRDFEAHQAAKAAAREAYEETLGSYYSDLANQESVDTDWAPAHEDDDEDE